MSKKTVIVVNGKGGVGKDTLCNACSRMWNCKIVSSIDPIKEAAKCVGWTGDKTRKSRLFLSELKSLVTEYNDYPNQHLCREYDKFMKDDDAEILFIFIREAENIDKFKYLVKPIGGDVENGEVKTLLISRPEIDRDIIGNISDDEVFGYDYDYIYYNDSSLEYACKEFVLFISDIINGRVDSD